ncbi:MAG TPA: SRPBCC domain-containing protein [Vitreimonas sp.]|uniref:SRPBCC domain-containing protein n=1 Tax=Vitreimonas sp. TaxID=3069702 RepID=UPI002D651068|nr:SRPBCC domain-containing protein [Vitreimonas sp.]HYD88343.1 SRPBCC domain-containing protein [Vitreimonas sp.]
MSAVIVSLRVKASPREAFDMFTQEIAAWWRPNGLFQITPGGDGVLRFEGEERLITTLPNGKAFEIGCVTSWLPGERLAFTWRQASFSPEQQTHVEVRFEPVGDETRVTVEHRGWDAIPQGHAARHGFPLAATQMRLAEHWRALLGALAATLVDERR